jgi:glycosyltransferase involved in cell wall biosynthesis
MKPKKNKVSIILNCYNGEKYLEEALSSIKGQTYKNWELIFWDNRSTDNSQKILKLSKIKKTRYFLSKKHTSLYAARNLAMKKASGDFISFIDADDLWDKNKLKKQIKLFHDKKTAVVYGNSWLKNEKNNKKKKFINYEVKSGYIYKDLIKRYNIGILTSIIRKSILKKSKISFDRKYDIIGDFDFFLRLSKEYKFKFIQDPVATYRIHNHNLSFLKKSKQIKEFFYWIKKNKKDLTYNEYFKIKQRIHKLEFINIKLTQSFFKTFFYFKRYLKYIFNLKNIVILFLPIYFLKKVMWFI